MFRHWLEYFGWKYGKITVAIPPHNTSQNCSNCGEKVPKSLSNRPHACNHCGYVADRDVNASINILKIALRTAGHAGTAVFETGNAWGEGTSISVGSDLPGQVLSLNQESHG
jgi:putative transposase